MKRILVTGGTGFAGAAVVDALSQADTPVLATIRGTPPQGTGIDVSWITADLTDSEAWNSLKSPAAIVHCAAVLPGSFANPDEAATANRRLDDAMLAFAERQGVPVVYSSGTAVYAAQIDPVTAVPLAENASLDPPSAYIREKVRTEERGRDIQDRTGVPFTSLRICAPYGPGQTSRTVLRIFIERALRGEPLLYHGNGTREQDLTWIDDVARACLAALQGPGGVYNIASGVPVSMRSLAGLVACEAGLSDDKVRASGECDPQEGWCARFDIQAVRDALGWSPSVFLEGGIQRLMNKVRH